MPNGFGSCYKMKGRLRKSWRAVKDRITVGYFETKAEGLRALALYDKNAPILKSKLTLKDIYEEWYEYESKTKSQAEAYHAAWRYLEPLYNRIFNELRANEMQKIIKEVSETKSNSTIKPIIAILKKVFAYASAHDIITKDYSDFLKLPKEESKKKIPFNDIQIKAIESSNNEWRDSVLVLLYTGLRISELLELTRFNIDLKEWVINGGKKTNAGKNRIIPIHSKIQPIIKKWIDLNGTYLLEYKGKRIRPDTYRDFYFKPFLLELGIENMTPHNCRHTTATLLSKAGADTISIQKILGHASYQTTADTYTSVDLEQLRNAIKKIR